MRKRIQHLLFESELHLLFEDYRTDKIMQMVNKRLPAHNSEVSGSDIDAFKLTGRF